MIARPAWIEIDRAAIRHNVGGVLGGLTGGARLMAVVKANAYGHGDVGVATAALEAGATWLGVILVDEGLRLREAGIDAPILLLHEPLAHRLDEALGADLTPTVFTETGLAAVGRAAEHAGRSVRVHLKIDTGLNRLGLPSEAVEDFARALAKEPRVEVEASFTHFAFADDPSNPFIDEQLARFEDACERLKHAGVAPEFRHVANSAASITRPDAHYDMVRLGIAMYGLSPGPKTDGVIELRPALALKARVAMVKQVAASEAISYGHRYRLEQQATVATIPLGYADGWPRVLTNNAEILIGGERRPSAGTVTMDSFMVDLGADECAIGDEAVLIGAQGGGRITADELAERAGTINYEIVTRLSRRLPREFHG